MAFINQIREAQIDGPVLLSSFVLNVLGMLMPLATLLIFDRVIPFQSTDTLTLITLILVGSALCEFGLKWARSTILGWASQKAAVQNHEHFLGKLLNANTERFKSRNKPVLLDSYSAVGRLRDFFSGQNQALSIDVPFTGMFIVMIALIGGWLVVVPLAALVVVLILALGLKRAQASIFDARKQLDERRYAFLFEVLDGIIPAKANAMERQLTRRFEMLQQQSVASSHRLIMFSGFSQNLSAVFSQTCVAALGLTGAYLVIEGHIGVAELAACMMLNGRVTQPLMKLITLWVQSESISQQMAKLSAVEGLKQIPPMSPTLTKLSGHIEFAKLRIPRSHEDQHQSAALSARVQPGEIVLIDCGSGFERAVERLFSVLTGQVTPSSGRVLFDGYLPKDVTRFRGKNGLALLEDEPAIFHGTLVENLLGFGGAQSIDRVLEYSRKIGLENRVNRLPLGYNTLLNSGGSFEADPVNRQLIALTRVFALEPKILLMNEPTAVLDQRERETLKSFIQSMPNRPSILMASPDPRMKSLTSQTLKVVADSRSDFDAWYEDASLDQMEQTEKGAA